MNSPLPPTFETSRCTLHRHRREDAEEMFYAYASKPEVTRFLIWPTHSSIEETRQYLRYAIAQWDADQSFAWTVRLKPYGRLIGSIGLVKSEAEWQVGYVFSPTSWGKGLASEVLIGLLGLIKGHLNEPIVSYVHQENPASSRVLEKAGFIRTADPSEQFVFPNLNGGAHPGLKFRLNG
ncbi:MAG: GNAT family N-acetyltransferase [Bacteroidota bacterium]